MEEAQLEDLEDVVEDTHGFITTPTHARVFVVQRIIKHTLESNQIVFISLNLVFFGFCG